MLLKLFRSIVIGLIVAGLLLVAMPSLRQFNKLSAPQFDSTDETPATYNQAVRRAAPAVEVYPPGTLPEPRLSPASGPVIERIEVAPRDARAFDVRAGQGISGVTVYAAGLAVPPERTW